MCVAAEGRLCTPRTHRAALELAGRPPCPRGTGPGEAESQPRSKAWEILTGVTTEARRTHRGVIPALSASPAPWGPLRVQKSTGREKSRVISKALKSPHSELREDMSGVGVRCHLVGTCGTSP